LEEALALMERYGDRARPIAGGTDLVVAMKYRSMLQLVDGVGTDAARFASASRMPPILRPDVVVSLADLPELKGMTTQSDPDVLRVGPGTTMTEMDGSDIFPPALLAVRDAARTMGSPLIRNQATIGGNIINARPAADSAVAALALAGKFQLVRAKSERWVDASEFFTGPGQTVKRGEELLVAIDLPFGSDEGSAYLRRGTRRQLEIALASAATWIKIDPSTGVIADARVSLGAVAPTPILAPKAAQGLVGKPPSEESFSAAGAVARTETRVIDDYRGSAAYRLEMVDVLVRRALEISASRALGKGGRS
jgi:carbon-monoxide dehydrogenase medium subunit